MRHSFHSSSLSGARNNNNLRAEKRELGGGWAELYRDSNTLTVNAAWAVWAVNTKLFPLDGLGGNWSFC